MGAVKSFLKLKDLEEGKSYKILRVKKIKTKYGDAITVTLKEGILILPSRFNEVDHIALKKMVEEEESGLALIKIPGLGIHPSVKFEIL